MNWIRKKVWKRCEIAKEKVNPITFWLMTKEIEKLTGHSNNNKKNRTTWNKTKRNQLKWNDNFGAAATVAAHNLCVTGQSGIRIGCTNCLPSPSSNWWWRWLKRFLLAHFKWTTFEKYTQHERRTGSKRQQNIEQKNLPFLICIHFIEMVDTYKALATWRCFGPFIRNVHWKECVWIEENGKLCKNSITNGLWMLGQQQHQQRICMRPELGFNVSNILRCLFRSLSPSLYLYVCVLQCNFIQFFA